MRRNNNCSQIKRNGSSNVKNNYINLFSNIFITTFILLLIFNATKNEKH